MSFFDKLKDKTKKLTHSLKERIEFLDSKEFQLDEHNFSNLVIKAFNGTVKVVVHNEKIVRTNCKVTVVSTTHTEVELKDAFARKDFVRITDNSLTVTVNDNKNLIIDLELSLPIEALQYLKFEGINCKFKFNEVGSIIPVNNIKVSNLNGKIQIDNVDCEEAVIDVKSGDIFFKGHADKLTTKTLNGQLHNVITSERPAIVEAVTVNGSIYLAVTKEIGLSGKLNTNFGGLEVDVEDCSITDDINQKLLKMKSVQKQRNQKLIFLCETRKGDVLVEHVKELS